MGDAPEQPPALRASDVDRERAADLVRIAGSDGRLTVAELEDRLGAVYAARTQADLELVLADLGPGSTVGQLPATSAAMPVRTGPGATRWVVSIICGHDRRGRWRVARRCRMINLMGGGEIDLTSAELAAPSVQITVFSLMGGGTVRVPDGVHVSVGGFAIMGGNDVRLGDDPVDAGPVQVRLRLISVMGGATVRRGVRRSGRGRSDIEDGSVGGGQVKDGGGQVRDGR